MLTPRRIEIFKAIVDEYIQTAEPVGSKALQQKYRLPYSSATIRNDMMALEDMGYLEKVHTSSGRIPSTLGYKFYCENLLQNTGLDRKMQVAIREAFDTTNMNIEEAVQVSCRVLSDMTNMTAGAIGPDAKNQHLAYIKLFPIDERNAVCVFITDTGHSETKTFHFDEDVLIQDIESCTDLLNTHLKGVAIADLPERMEELRPQFSRLVKQHETLFAAFVKAFVKFASETVYFSGRERMLYQPEFEDISKLKKLMEMMKDAQGWRSIDSGERAVALRTNKKSELTWVDDVAIVRTKFRINDMDSGQLMVVGPSRMDYDKVISMLEYAVSIIENVYSDNGGRHE
ncbi:MAG: heat-inducible transcription repressor HrcA [Solobacterium sp.]|nr:heat-inducible transcription repressor HrcA [Solobacterium sp.]